MRHTRGHTRNRRSHHALTAVDLTLCSNCGQPTPKHMVCKNCGFFKGRMVIDMAAKIDKKAVKAQKAETVSKA
ncbi:MAG: 50S ribosomal protein L32 [Patescibacteria group bacterium]